MSMKFTDFEEEIDGPEASEVKAYEFDENHFAADTMKQFAIDVARKQTEPTSKRYFRGMKTYVAWLDIELGKTDPLDVTEDVIGDYLMWLVNTAWSRNARKSKFAAIQRFYRWARDEGPLNEHLAEDRSIKDYRLDPGALEESRKETEEDDDYKWVQRRKIVQLWRRENIPSPRLRNELLFKLLWYTGCRCGAIAEARIGEDSLDRENARLKVPNLKKGGEQADYRWVDYPRERIEPLLADWLDGGRRDAIGPHGEESDFLFLTHMKPKMRPTHISRLVKKAAFNADVQEVAGYDVNGNPRWLITGHTVRHSAATYWANETDVSLHHISTQLGHSKIETTMKYVHDDRGARKRAFEQAWG